MSYNPADPTPWVIGLLVLVLGYFLRDAHLNLKIGLEKRATQAALDDARESWRADLREQNERHQRESARMEQQYEQKFAAVVSQFQGQMNSMEKNLNDKIDMILHIVERRNP